MRSWSRHQLTPDERTKLVSLVLVHQVTAKDAAQRFGVAPSTAQEIVRHARRQGVASSQAGPMFHVERSVATRTTRRNCHLK